MQIRSALPPFPNGWFLFGFTDELKPGALLARTFMGQEVVVFRGESGQAAALDAFCPHLGAHLGVGGRVQGDTLRCPFHGFRFDASGVCVQTGYGTKPPPKARLRAWPLREQNGLLLVYHHLEGCEPEWEVPALDMQGWTRLRYRRFLLRDHPQETTENSVDLGHFAFVHGYRNPRMLREARTDGPHLNTAYAVSRGLPGLERLLPGLLFDFEFETAIYGLGYSLVKVNIPLLGAEARLWVLPTALEDGRLALHLALSLKILRPGRISPWLGWLPARPTSELLAGVIFDRFLHDTAQDFPIWENKRYLDPPALAQGDGPIGRYRLWAKQFYTREAEQDA